MQKSPENRSAAAANRVSETADRHRATRVRDGDLPATLPREPWHESLNQSSRVESQLQLKQILNRSPQLVAQGQLAQALSDRKSGPQMPVQRKCSICAGEESEETVQRRAGTTAMPDDLLGNMESSLGSDFSDVKFHKNSQQAVGVGALAYTRANEVHFAPGQFQPDTTRGRELIGHELTHVVQQRQGKVKPTTQAAGLPVNDDPFLEREADRMGQLAAHGQRAVAGALPAASTGTRPVIQGVFPNDHLQQVATGKQVTGTDTTTNQPETLSGVFVLNRVTPQGCEIMALKTANIYLVDSAQINDASLWENPPSNLIPQIAPLVVSPEITTRKGKTKGTETVYKNRPAKRTRDQNSLERASFYSVNKKDVSQSEKSFLSPGAESTGFERIALLRERTARFATETIKESSVVGRSASEQTITYCSYCLNWFSPPQLDSDHGITWKVIGQWLVSIANRMNTEGQGFVQAVTLQFQAVGLDVRDFFRQLSGKTWDVTDQGADLMFNNVKNLALSCKTCNQLERNDEEFMDFMKRNVHFGAPFLLWLVQQGAKFEGKEVVSSTGQYAGELIDQWLQITPYVQEAIEHYRRIKIKSLAETERVKKLTRATIEGKKKTAQGAAEKQAMHHVLFDLIEESYKSEGEEEAAELLKQLPPLVKEIKGLVQQGITVQPEQNIKDLATLTSELDEAREELSFWEEEMDIAQEDFEGERQLHIETLAELKQLQTRLQQSEAQVEQERERAERAEQRELVLQQKNLDLHSETQELQRQLVEMQKLLKGKQ